MLVSLTDTDYIDILYNQGNPEVTTTTAPPVEGNNTIHAKDEEEDLFSCDHRISLFILNQKYFIENMGVPRTVHSDTKKPCLPPFWASHVRKTNLLMVVVEKGEWEYEEECPLPPDTKPQPTSNSTTSREPCHKLELAQLERRRLEGCFTYHEKVITFYNLKKFKIAITPMH